MPPGFPHAGMESAEAPAVFVTRWFVDRAQAVAWVTSG
jgi:hypothetical protein